MSPPLFRIPVPVMPPLPIDEDGLDAPVSTLQGRDESGNGGKPHVQIAVLVFAGLAGAVVLVFLSRFVYLRFFLRSRYKYKPAIHEEDSPATRQINRHNQDTLEDALTEAHARLNGNNASTAAVADVTRNTSIRSVMTLPAYRPKPSETELVLGREGERDGMDVVVEMRTAEEEEALRDEEMEALYQIRAARRRQIEEREERRRRRREARENNDLVALRELREQARDHAARNTSEIEELRQEHERVRETRQRAVSSVSYADVGIARADGTRVRANSTESSERVGLLSDAASIAAESLFRRRDRSASATLSIDTSRTLHDRSESPALSTTGGSGMYSLASAGRTRSRTNSGATTPRIPTPSLTTTPRAGSSPEIIDAEDADLGDIGIPPPGYDEVSLDEVTPLHSRRNSDVSGTASPYPDPPPNYPGPGPADMRNSRLSAHMEDLAAQAQADDNAEARVEMPTLPSLRLHQVPQIVIEPSSARP
ncbi:hypothetical protein C8A03DRAFT_12200 [Achaetomium macrosporum]|uniref:Uncharacterized protein n=1 Tax=Achaetomium macrosporum TaxID=79813 RepID=A0AAN7CGT8_9PEZI|nr:hypothetical protein C8A03DRAFT_12200 [Achaetomium macrosporum]